MEKSLTNFEQVLHNKIKTLVKIERKTLVQILDHLQRVYDSRLFAKMGYPSLIKYLIKEHGYSESAAYRRFQALKLAKEIPEIKTMVKEGKLHLSGISTLQSMMKSENSQVKKEMINKIQNKTNNEIQTELFKLLPQKELPKEHKRKISATETRISLNLNQKMMDKIEKFKAQTKCYDTVLVLEKALDIALSSTDMTKVKSRKTKESINPRHISPQIKREILIRAENRCEYPGCKGIHYLEFDHVRPVSQGGTNEKSNIRLLCRSHNQFFAIERLGFSHMKSYLQ